MAKNKRTPKAAPPAAGLEDDDLGFPEEELEQLFAQALAAGASKKSAAASKPRSQKPAEETLPSPSQDDEPRLPDELFDIDDSEFGEELGMVPTDHDPSGMFEDVDRELQEALAEAELDDDELDASLRELIDGGMVGTPPDAPPQHRHSSPEEILGLGDHGAIPLHLEDTSAEATRLQREVADLKRQRSMQDLELRTAKDRITALEQQVIAATRQAAGTRREFEAYRRRMERERDDLKKFAAEKVIKEFLVVNDNLARALEHAWADRDGALGQGVEMILDQFVSALKRCGVTEVESAPGQPFDPQWHEAVGQEFSDTIPPGNIVNRMHQGFTLNERLLRAAMVTVSKGPKIDPADRTETSLPTLSRDGEDRVTIPGHKAVPGPDEAEDADGDATEDGASEDEGDAPVEGGDATEPSPDEEHQREE